MGALTTTNAAGQQVATRRGERILADPNNLGIKRGDSSKRNKGAALFTALTLPRKSDDDLAGSTILTSRTNTDKYSVLLG